MSELFEALRARGWEIKEQAGVAELLPAEVRARYPHVPAAVAEFLGGLDVCHNATEDAWMLTPEDFRKTDPDGFRWNEYELMAKEAYGHFLLISDANINDSKHASEEQRARSLEDGGNEGHREQGRNEPAEAVTACAHCRRAHPPCWPSGR